MSLMTYCFNTSGSGLTLWPGMSFTRIWRVGAKHYGVNGSGVYELTGNTDNGTAYTSHIVTAATSLETSDPKTGEVDTMRLKHLPLAHVDAVGTATVTALLDGVSSVSTLEFNGTSRVRFGRGLRGRRVAMDFQSTDAAFELHAIEFKPQPLQRGVK
jgi:hypothetical protein